MNHATYYTVPETFTIQHAGLAITGRVLERSVRRLTVQLIDPYGLLHTTKRVHPSIGGALGFEGTAGDHFKVELLMFLYDRAVQINNSLPLIVQAYQSHGLAEACIQRLQPVIGSYAPFNAHSFILATNALENRPTALPDLPLCPVPPHLLIWEDLKILVYLWLKEGRLDHMPFGKARQPSAN